jgi:hypothetical protein
MFLWVGGIHEKSDSFSFCISKRNSFFFTVFHNKVTIGA